MSHFVIAGLRGNAGAGGAMLALAADHIYARSGVVLNPHYRSMGGLFGSEYWTYTLPRRVGQKRALELTTSCRPIGTRVAREIGYLDDAFGEDTGAFEAELRERARRLARDPEFRLRLRTKHERRLDDEYCQAPRELSRQGAGTDAGQFLRARPRLSRGPPALRLQGESAAAADPSADSNLGRGCPLGSLTGSGPGRHWCWVRSVTGYPGSRLIRTVREWGDRCRECPGGADGKRHEGAGRFTSGRAPKCAKTKQ